MENYNYNYKKVINELECLFRNYDILYKKINKKINKFNKFINDNNDYKEYMINNKLNKYQNINTGYNIIINNINKSNYLILDYLKTNEKKLDEIIKKVKFGNLYHRKYYNNNNDKRKQYLRNYYQENKEKIKQNNSNINKLYKLLEKEEIIKFIDTDDDNDSDIDHYRFIY